MNSPLRSLSATRYTSGMTQMEEARQVLIDFGCDTKTAERLAGNLSRKWDEQGGRLPSGDDES